jgi:DNA-binding winged helix-turn-helix (wHTH) protein
VSQLPTQPAARYAQILEGVTEELERNVLTILVENEEKLVSRQDLIYAIFSERVNTADLINNDHDRAIRSVIENLRQRSYPIVSTPGAAGYKFTTDEKEIWKTIETIRARKDSLTKSESALLRALSKANQMRQWIEAPAPEGVQARLM